MINQECLVARVAKDVVMINNRASSQEGVNLTPIQAEVCEGCAAGKANVGAYVAEDRLLTVVAANVEGKCPMATP